MAAGLYAMRAALNTVLIERGLPGGQIAISKDVENYPGIEGVTGFDLAEKLLRHAKSYGLNMIQQEVRAVEPGPDFHIVRLANGEQLQAYALILATGGAHLKLNVPGEEEYFGKGVSYCGTCDGFFFRDKTVVVVGGGDTAVEEALYLSKIARKVYLVHRRDTLRASKILQKRLLADPKIETVWNSVVTEVKGNDEEGVNAVALNNVQTGESREVATDGFFVFVGYSPTNQLVPPGVQMSKEGYVITDEKCETCIPGIFAVGDLRKKYVNQIIVAAADGCTAALAAAHYVEAKKS
jgi:thioredoxin reductase (NADPH)